eukprot:767543-Hanusia_phi.AAC.1
MEVEGDPPLPLSCPSRIACKRLRVLPSRPRAASHADETQDAGSRGWQVVLWKCQRYASSSLPHVSPVSRNSLSRWTGVF